MWVIRGEWWERSCPGAQPGPEPGPGCGTKFGAPLKDGPDGGLKCGGAGMGGGPNYYCLGDS